MAKETVTLTLDAGHLAALRSLMGVRGLSETVDEAIAAYLERAKHLAAVDARLKDLDEDPGSVPQETLEWADHLVDELASRKGWPKAH